MMVPFLYGPILPHRSHFFVVLWWVSRPNILLYQLKLTQNHEVMISMRYLLSFLIFVGTNYCELKSLSQMFLLSSTCDWHNNFISKSYGWHTKARFVIFGCFFITLDYTMLFFISIFHIYLYCVGQNPNSKHHIKLL